MNRDKELAQVVAQCVRKYARVCWWTDADDLRQQAWVAALEALRTWDENKGQLAPYAWRAVQRALSNFCIYQSSPVHAPWHKRKELIGTRRAPTDGLDASPLLRDDNGFVEEAIDDATWRVRTLARLFEVVGKDDAQGLEELLREDKRVGKVTDKVHQSMHRVRERISRDAGLKELLNERKGR